MGYLVAVIKWFVEGFKEAFSIYKAPVSPKTPTTSPISPKPNEVPMNPPTDPYLTTILPWTSQKNNYHNVRVICDRVGLTLIQKDILCACVYQESRFLTNPKPNENLDKNGNVWSTDYGIAQVNDHYHIGPGKDFPSVQYVLTHPEQVITWMAKIMKNTGGLQPWSSYSSGVYKKWLLANSPMWLLRN